MSRLRRLVIRLGKVVAVLVALLVLGHTVATIVTGRMLAREIQRLKAAGEPLTLAEAAPKPVPDDENAAPLYAEAYRKMRLSREDSMTLSDFGTFVFWTTGAGGTSRSLPPYSPPPGGTPQATWPTPAEIRRILARNSETIALIEAAARLPHCVIPVNWNAPGATYVNEIFPPIGRMKTFARLLIAKGNLLLVEHKPDQALEVCRTMFRMSEHLAWQPTLITHLTRIALQAIAASEARIVLQSSPSFDACRTAFEVISHVDDRPGLVQAIKGGRALVIGGFRHPEYWKAGNFIPRMPPGIPGLVRIVLRHVAIGSYLARPVLNADEVDAVRMLAGAIEDATRPYGAGAKRAFARLGGLVARPTPLSGIGRGRGGYAASPWHAVTADLLPAFDGVALATSRGNACIGLTQVALAVEAYRAKTGAYPETLSQASRLLGWKLSDDPFSGRVFIYRREGKGFVAYSVGPNQRDDGGKGEPGLHLFDADIVWRVSR